MLYVISCDNYSSYSHSKELVLTYNWSSCITSINYCLTARYPYGGSLIKVQQYQSKMGFYINICSQTIVYKYFFTYLHTVSMQTSKTHIFPSHSTYVFALPDGGHLWPYGIHHGLMGQNDVITSYRCQNGNPRVRRTLRSVFIHVSMCSGAKVTFSFY